MSLDIYPQIDWIRLVLSSPCNEALFDELKFNQDMAELLFRKARKSLGYKPPGGRKSDSLRGPKRTLPKRQAAMIADNQKDGEEDLAVAYNRLDDGDDVVVGAES